MLVLSRKLNQSVQVGPNITVSIVRIKGNVVQLGIYAPREIHVLRSELLERDAQTCEQRVRAKLLQSESMQPPSSDDQVAADSQQEPEAKLLAAG